VPAESVEEQWDLPALQRVLAAEWGLPEIDLLSWVQQETSVDDQDIVEHVIERADQAFGAKVDLVGAEQFTPFMRMVLLQSIDNHWREHLAALDHLRQGIHLRGYAQKQPKQEYKREAFELFSMLLDLVKNEVTRTLMTVQIQTREEADQAAQQLEERAENISNVTYTAPTETGEVETTVDAATVAASVPQVGRNDPCPCGSGKKYKHCHGKLS
jgi:preprotein translocase subunit SecA